MGETGVILKKSHKINVRKEIFIYSIYFLALYVFCTFNNLILHRVVRKRGGMSCKSTHVLNIMVMLHPWERIRIILPKSRENQFIVPVTVNFETYSRNYYYNYNWQLL